MPLSGFESLSPEILHQVSEYLDKKSFYAFASTSKRYEAIANSRLYRKIRVNVESRKKIQLDVGRWIRFLGSNIRHVRQLEIYGDLQFDTGQPSTGEDVKAEVVDDDIEFASQASSWALIADDKTPGVVVREDENWWPLADFIRQLPPLTDLLYHCSQQLPPCLLKALHESCRLHLRTFRFRGPLQGEVDPHEFALPTFPSLHSIVACRVIFERQERYAKDDFNREAIMRIVSGMAPRIKEVHFFNVRGSSTLDTAINIRKANPRPPWRGFSLDKNKALIVPGKSTKLELSGYPIDLRIWAMHVDFSCLRILMLGEDTQSEDLLWVVENCPFRVLTMLELFLDLECYGGTSPDEYYDLVNSFFLCLPPLKVIRVFGSLTLSIFETVLDYHGKSLHHLRLDDFSGSPGYVLWNFNEKYRLVFDHSQFKKIQQRCQLLEELTLPISRTKGDLKEVAIYQMLGDIPRLQKIALTLNISNPITVLDSNNERQSPNDPPFDEFDQQTLPFDFDDECHDATDTFEMPSLIVLLTRRLHVQSSNVSLVGRRMGGTRSHLKGLS